MGESLGETEGVVVSGDMVGKSVEGESVGLEVSGEFDGLIEGTTLGDLLGFAVVDLIKIFNYHRNIF